MPKAARRPKNLMWGLAHDVRDCLQEALTRARFPAGEFNLALQMILSRNPYARTVLFRSFGAPQSGIPVLHVRATAFEEATGPFEEADRPAANDDLDASPDEEPAPLLGHICEQATCYVNCVFLRPMELAPALVDQPSNMHKLAVLLYRLASPEHFWALVRAERSKERYALQDCEPSFSPVAGRLDDQIKQQGERSTARSHTARKRYGAIWLTAAQCGTQMPEEMGFFDVLEAAPLPLRQPLGDAVLEVLNDVLETLNKRYSLLRSCGLDPDDWHHRHTLEVDAKLRDHVKTRTGEGGCRGYSLSVSALRDLKRLRETAQALQRTGEVSGPHAVHAAFEQAFARLLGTGKAFAGFKTFQGFASMAFAREMMNLNTVAWNDTEGYEEPAALSEEEDAVMSEQLADLLDDEPFAREELAVKYVLLEAGINGRPVHRERGDQGVFADRTLARLVAASPVLAALSQDELREALQLKVAAFRDKAVRILQTNRRVAS